MGFRRILPRVMDHTWAILREGLCGDERDSGSTASSTVIGPRAETSCRLRARAPVEAGRNQMSWE